MKQYKQYTLFVIQKDGTLKIILGIILNNVQKYLKAEMYQFCSCAVIEKIHVCACDTVRKVLLILSFKER